MSIILINKDKSPRRIRRGTDWQDPEYDHDIEWALQQEPGTFGMKPERVGDCVVLDYDNWPETGSDVEYVIDLIEHEWGARPFYVHPSAKPGRHHLWYRGGPSGNRSWAIDGHGGETRRDRGYIAMHYPLQPVLDAYADITDPRRIDMPTGPITSPTAIDTDEPRWIYTSALDSIERVLADLRCADLDYDEWMRVGAALWAETNGDEIGFDIWDAWSAADDARYNSKEMSARWRSFSDYDGPRVGAGTVVHISREHGLDPTTGTTSPFLMDLATVEPEASVEADLGRFGDRHLFYSDRVNVLYGYQGSGKSWLALIVAREAVESGTRVLWLDAEDTPHLLAARAEAIGWDVPADMMMYGSDMQWGGKRFAEGQAAVAEWLGSRALVILDAISSWGGPEDNPADYIDWHRRIMRTWPDGTGVLAIDHEAKHLVRGQSGTSAKGRVLTGSQVRLKQIQGFSRTAPGKSSVYVTKDRRGTSAASEDDPVAMMRAEPGDTLDIAVEPFDWTAYGSMMTDVQREILDAVAGGHTTVEDIRTAVGKSRPYVQRKLVELVKDEHLLVDKQGNTNHYRRVER